MCNITYRGVAVSTPEGRTTVSYDTTFRVHKELLSQVLNTVLRVRERDSRQVGDPFITPYLAGVYQRLGLEYSSLLCFTRVTLLWRRIAAARAEAAAGTAAAAAAAAPSSRPAAARVASMDWHVQQLHRELVLEPWKAADLRLMLGRAAAYAEVQTAAGGGAGGGGGLAGGGIPGSWLPRHASALVGTGGGGMRAGAGARGGCGGGGGGGGKGAAACEGSAAVGRPRRGGAGAGVGAGVFASALFWGMWAVCPTMLVALEAMQAAPDNPWMALYICAIATCRTLAEWRAAASLALAPRLSAAQRLYGMAVVHLASGLASAVVTGLLNTWLPLLGHGAAAALVWLHLLLLPVVMVAIVGVAGMPGVARQLAGGSGATAGGDGGGGGADGGPRRSGGRDRRYIGGGGGNDPLGASPGRRVTREGDRGGHVSGGGGSRGGVSATAAAVAAAQVHWPPALEVPTWLDDWPNAPEAFRCPITQSLMREPAQASSGVTYERPAILQWLEHRRVDPVTHVPLKRHRLAPNLNLRHMIEVWVQDRVEARRRLAQRLREEVSAEVAAAAAAGGGGGDGDGDGDGPPVASATAAESSCPPVRELELELGAAAGAAAGRFSAAAKRPLSSGGADGGDGTAAAAATSAEAAPAAATAAGAVEPEAAASVQPRAAATGRVDGCGVGGSDDLGSDGPGTQSEGFGTRAMGATTGMAEVEALALSAARARAGCRRRGPELGSDGGGTTAGRRCGGGSGGRPPPHGAAARGSGGGGDGGLGADDRGGASTESPFTTTAAGAPGSSSGPEPYAAGLQRSGGGGGWHVYDATFGAGRDPSGAVAAASGLRRRWRARLGSTGGGAAAGLAPPPPPPPTTTTGSLAEEPSWGMVWGGADPDSSGVLAVDGSVTSTGAAAGSAATSLERPSTQEPATHHQHPHHPHHHHHHRYHHPHQQPQPLPSPLRQLQPQRQPQPQPGAPQCVEGRRGSGSDDGQAAPVAAPPAPSGSDGAAAARPAAAAATGQAATATGPIATATGAVGMAATAPAAAPKSSAATAVASAAAPAGV